MYCPYKIFVICVLFFAADCHASPTDDLVSLCDLPRTPYKENARMIVQGLDQVLQSSDYSTLQKVIENPNGFLEKALQTTLEHAKAKRKKSGIRCALKRFMHPARTKLLEFDLETMDSKTILTLLAGQAIKLEGLDKEKNLNDLFWTKYYMRESLENLQNTLPAETSLYDAFEKFKTNRAHAPETQTPSLPEQFTLVAYTATLLEQKGQLKVIRDKL